jgi:formylglycine-generating enzyme required for sulfatase activity
MEANAPRYVFISFASEDVELAHRVVERLERSGIRCWISDRDIEPAASYPAAITHAVRESGALLLLLTESSNTSAHVLREVELAFNTRRPVLPVRISGVTPSSDLQYFLSTTQWLDAGSTVDDTDFAHVEPRLTALLEGVKDRHQTGRRRRWPLIVAPALAVATLLTFLLWSERRTNDPVSTERAIAPQPAARQADEVPSGAGSAAAPVVAPARGDAKPSGVTVRVNSRDGQAYLWIPPGRFVMGCSAGDPACEDDEKPAHAVEIKSGFWLARTEVTQAQYRRGAVVARAAREGADADLPVTDVDWAAAKASCAAAGARLPTEAEWEYAARAGTSTRYYDSLPAIAWFADNADGGTHPVGTKAPNAFGLYDMLGNASEWVRDRYYNAYDDSGDNAVEEPLAGNASGVARGGSWVSDARGVRVSRRLALPPDAQEPHVGFRCAMDRF